MDKFAINSIVKGKVCGTFVVLGWSQNMQMYRLKEICPISQKPYRGELCLPADALVSA